MRLAYGVGIALVVSACGTPAHRPPATAPRPGPAPSLVVLVVVDQLPVRLFDRVKPAFTGGLQRLTGSDAFQAVGEYAYARTLTCPGHATLSTGAAPATSGIPANAWSADGEMVYCGDVRFLRAEPLADVVHAHGGRVASLSIKDRAAVMLGGHDADVVAWMEGLVGNLSEQPRGGVLGGAAVAQGGEELGVDLVRAIGDCVHGDLG